METQLPDLSALMNTPTQKTSSDNPVRKNKKSLYVTLSLALLLFFFGITSAVLIWQTRKTEETIARVETQAAEEPPSTCNLIKIYKNGQVVAPTSLQPGDAIVVATPKGTATKARFTLNGFVEETTNVNTNNEFIQNVVLNSTTTSVVIRVERFINDVWQ
jgi:hypothetical protein